MKFKENFCVESALEPLWESLMDVRRVAACLSGVEELEVVENDKYRGLIAVSMGPVRLRFSGEVNVTLRDKENWTAILQARAKDAKAGGGFRASLRMQLSTSSATTTDLLLELETTFLGRIGELGRPLIKRKISSMMTDFVRSLNAQLVPVNS